MNGLPLHALAVHATVVLVPLLALLGVAWAVPRLRAWSRWPLALVAVGASASTWVSMQSGNALESALRTNGSLGGPIAEAVDRHRGLAGQLQGMVYAYAVLALVGVLLQNRLAGTSGGERTTERAAARGSGALAVVFSAVLVLGAVALAVQVARVGDAGAHAVWNPTGETSYSAD